MQGNQRLTEITLPNNIKGRANCWQGAGHHAGAAGQDRRLRSHQAEENTMTV